MEWVVGSGYVLMSQLLSAVKGTAINAALSYAWIKISFDAWEYGLNTGRVLLRWAAWPQAVKSALFALYPMYFAYSSAKMIAEWPESHKFPSKNRWPFSLTMVVLFIIGTAMGRRHGAASRLTE